MFFGEEGNFESFLDSIKRYLFDLTQDQRSKPKAGKPAEVSERVVGSARRFCVMCQLDWREVSDFKFQVVECGNFAKFVHISQVKFLLDHASRTFREKLENEGFWRLCYI